MVVTTKERRYQVALGRNCPAFLGWFGSIDDARGFCAVCFDQENHVQPPHRDRGCTPPPGPVTGHRHHRSCRPRLDQRTQPIGLIYST
jgi:hypothetical protein